MAKVFRQRARLMNYYDHDDNKRLFSIMVKADTDQGFRSVEKKQQKIIELAKKKVADGKIFQLMKRITVRLYLKVV